MSLTVYIVIGRDFRGKEIIKGFSKDVPENLPEHKRDYWFQKLAKGRKIVGTMTKRFTGRTMPICS